MKARYNSLKFRPTRKYNDNIVAYWVPKAPVQAGSTRTFRYRLHWVADEPYWPDRGRVIATRLGWGDIPNVPPRPAHKTWFVIDFAGGPLEQLDRQAPVQVVASATRGKLRNSVAFQVFGTRRWRAKFDVELEDAEPVDLRAYLRLGDQALTETWLYQFIPRPVSS